MKKSICCGAAAFLLMASALLAADFWEKAEFVDWTDKDVQKMLFNSPWAKEVVVQRGGPGGGGGGGMGGPGGGMGGPGGGGRGGGAGGGGGGVGGGRSGGGRGGGVGGMQPGMGGGGAPAMRFLVRWHSSLPIKQAIIRGAMSAESELSAEQQEFLDREESHYIVMLSGIPQRMGARFAEDTSRLKQFATLERKGKEPVTPEQVEVRQTPQTMDLYFLFPRTDAITMGDKEVEFVFKMGGGRRGGGEERAAAGDDGQRGGGAGTGLDIKKKFKLKDMLFGDELAL